MDSRCPHCQTPGGLCHYIASDGATRCVYTELPAARPFMGGLSLSRLNPMPARRKDDPMVTEALSYIRAQYQRREARRQYHARARRAAVSLLLIILFAVVFFTAILVVTDPTPAQMPYSEGVP